MRAICHEMMLPSRQRTRSAPRNWTRFAAQYSAGGLPCERFTAGLADRISCITRGRGGWLNLPRGGLSPPILCQLVLAHSHMGQNEPCHSLRRHGRSTSISGPAEPAVGLPGRAKTPESEATAHFRRKGGCSRSMGRSPARQSNAKDRVAGHE